MPAGIRPQDLTEDKKRLDRGDVFTAVVGFGGVFIGAVIAGIVGYMQLNSEKDQQSRDERSDSYVALIDIAVEIENNPPTDPVTYRNLRTRAGQALSGVRVVGADSVQPEAGHLYLQLLELLDEPLGDVSDIQLELTAEARDGFEDAVESDLD